MKFINRLKNIGPGALVAAAFIGQEQLLFVQARELAMATLFYGLFCFLP